MTIAYIRISTNKQDFEVQKLQIFEYCHHNKISVDKIITVEQSSRKSQEKRQIDELKKDLGKDDLLITTELSRLGRSMFEIFNLVVELAEKGVSFVFLRQPELSSFKNAYAKLLLSIYAYVAETERELISQRTKAGLEKARNSGKTLGRPFNSFSSAYDEQIEEIKELIAKEIPLTSIFKLIGKRGTYQNFYKFCKTRKLI